MKRLRTSPRFTSIFAGAAAMVLPLLALAVDTPVNPAPSPSALGSLPVDDAAKQASIEKLCQDLKKSVAEFKWEIEPCGGIQWKSGGESVQGRPLIYAEFGDPQAPNTTLILTMVHGDEITPLYLGIQAAHWMREHLANSKGSAHVVVAPLVNPDSFFSRPRKRVNARGVDVNRNFATKDWHSKAIQLWRAKYSSNPRRFPGKSPASEPETLFQEHLIKTFQPQKILSVHAPLNFMDYDGPTTLSLHKFPKEYVRECLKLRARLKAISGGFFPGSLGNYAGQELGIPTLTLELPTADPAKAEKYWNGFKPGIRTMIDFKVPDYAGRFERQSTEKPRADAKVPGTSSRSSQRLQ